MPSLRDPQLDSRMSLRQAYLAMFEYLRRHHERGPTDVSFVLSQLQLLSDGGSADPAALQDWLDAVKVVTDAEATPPGYHAADFRLQR
jgi:hypothetical protein